MPHRTRTPRYVSVAPILLCITACIVFAWTLIGERGVLHLAELEQKLQALRDKNRRLESDIFHSEQELHRLVSDDKTLEQVAREELRMGQTHEIVYLFTDRAKQEKAQRSSEKAAEPATSSR